MRDTVLARGAWWASAAVAVSLGCGLIESTGGLSGESPGPEGGADVSTGALDALAEVAQDAPGPPDVTVVDVVDASSEEGAPPDGPTVDAHEEPVMDAVADTTNDVVDEHPVAPIAFVQLAVATPAGFSSTVAVPFAKAQVAGDLNIVVVGWNDTTAAVQAVSDTSGNTYTLAIGPTRLAPDLTQAIYYAPGIAAAAANIDKVTVTFVEAANVVDLRILEYSGLSTTAPLDAVGAATGNNAGPASAGAVTTTARELVFAAGMSTDEYSGPGTGFTMRILTSDGDMAEDRIVSTTGSYDAEGPLAASCEWVLQVATFR